MNATFKSYSEKSKARRALMQVHGIDKDRTDAFLTTVEGKPGFYLHEDGGPMPVEAVEQGANAASDAHLEARGEQFGEERKVEALPSEQDVQALAPQGDDTPAGEDGEDTPVMSTSAFGAFAASQLTAASNSTPAAEPVRTSQRVEGLKIQKDREAQNGVKERSKGGLCRAVWDELNSLMTHDEATGLANVPTVAQIKKIAEEKGWNVNNASIEYYQWRKFHGISGRGKKQI